MKRIVLILAAATAAGFVLIQLVPVTRSNPPVLSEPDWDSPETAALARAACYDCHSNETVWPFYAYIAPASWLVAHDVREGRENLNFSEWDNGGASEGEDLAEVVIEGEMPLAIYLPTHPEARLTADQREQLAAGLKRTAAANPGVGGERGGDD